MRQAELSRLEEVPKGRAPWRRWGPYVSERAWGTVREDYSATGDAWQYLPHAHARSKAYRWIPRRQLPGRVPHRLGKTADAMGRGSRAFPPARQPVPA